MPETLSKSTDQKLQAVARSALAEITPAGTIRKHLRTVAQAPGVFSVHFASTLKGYPGWEWVANLAQLEGAKPTVIELFLSPGGAALVAAEWIPFSVRMAQYQDEQAAELLKKQAAEADLTTASQEGESPSTVGSESLKNVEDHDEALGDALDEAEDDEIHLDEDLVDRLDDRGSSRGRDGVDIDGIESALVQVLDELLDLGSIPAQKKRFTAGDKET